MRGLGLRDCVPVGDAGLTLALQRWFGLEQRPDARETLRLMGPFAPHRSLATFHLWASLKGTPA
jgi:3-methyladenine DNA glycosylase/8-oxoguanine DNA glycosylase